MKIDKEKLILSLFIAFFFYMTVSVEILRKMYATIINSVVKEYQNK